MEWLEEALAFGTQMVVCFLVFICTQMHLQVQFVFVYVCNLQWVKLQPGVNPV